jgi:hypothetical protein
LPSAAFRKLKLNLRFSIRLDDGVGQEATSIGTSSSTKSNTDRGETFAEGIIFTLSELPRPSLAEASSAKDLGTFCGCHGCRLWLEALFPPRPPPSNFQCKCPFNLLEPPQERTSQLILAV